MTELLSSQTSFVFDSTVSDLVLPFSKSESTQTSRLMVKLESGLESDVTAASSSTSVGSGLFRGERTGSDGGLMARI